MEKVRPLAGVARMYCGALGKRGNCQIFTIEEEGQFETSLRRAILKGHNLHLPCSTASRSSPYIKPLSTFVTHLLV